MLTMTAVIEKGLIRSFLITNAVYGVITSLKSSPQFWNLFLDRENI